MSTVALRMAVLAPEILRRCWIPSPQALGMDPRVAVGARHRDSRYLALPFIPYSSKSGQAHGIGVGRNGSTSKPMVPRVFTDARIVTQKRSLRLAMTSVGRSSDAALATDWWVRVVYWRKNRGRRRGDPANLHHIVLDAAETVWWADDSQVRRLEIAETWAEREGCAMLARPLADAPEINL